MKDNPSRMQGALRAFTRPLAIAIGTWFCLASISQANTLRVLTSKDGRTLSARIVSMSAESVEVIRAPDSRRFTIPIATLSEADQKFLATWEPATSGWRPSSVAIRPCGFTQAKRPYTGPIYNTGSRSSRPRGYTVTWTNRCTGQTVVRHGVTSTGRTCGR